MDMQSFNGASAPQLDWAQNGFLDPAMANNGGQQVAASSPPTNMIFSAASATSAVESNVPRNNANPARATTSNTTDRRETSTRLKKVKPVKVKRPMNSFMVWARVERKKISLKNPKMHNSEISKQLGKIWRKMSLDDKQESIDKAKDLRDKHIQDHPDYRYKPRRKKKADAKNNTSGRVARPETSLPSAESLSAFRGQGRNVTPSVFDYSLMNSMHNPRHVLDAHGRFQTLGGAQAAFYEGAANAAAAEMQQAYDTMQNCRRMEAFQGQMFYPDGGEHAYFQRHYDRSPQQGHGSFNGFFPENANGYPQDCMPSTSNGSAQSAQEFASSSYLSSPYFLPSSSNGYYQGFTPLSSMVNEERPHSSGTSLHSAGSSSPEYMSMFQFSSGSPQEQQQMHAMSMAPQTPNAAPFSYNGPFDQHSPMSPTFSSAPHGPFAYSMPGYSNNQHTDNSYMMAPTQN